MREILSTTSKVSIIMKWFQQDRAPLHQQMNVTRLSTSQPVDWKTTIIDHEWSSVHLTPVVFFRTKTNYSYDLRMRIPSVNRSVTLQILIYVRNHFIYYKNAAKTFDELILNIFYISFFYILIVRIRILRHQFYGTT